MNRYKSSSDFTQPKQTSLHLLRLSTRRRMNSDKFISPVLQLSNKLHPRLSLNFKTTRQKLRNLLQNTYSKNEIFPITSKSLFPKLSPIIHPHLRSSDLSDSRMSRDTTLEQICTSLIFKH